jgi:hypothetical protein
MVRAVAQLGRSTDTPLPPNELLAPEIKTHSYDAHTIAKGQGISSYDESDLGLPHLKKYTAFNVAGIKEDK